MQAGAGQNPARQVALSSGLPISTPCVTINKVCGSSLKAAMLSNSIRAGEYKVVIAGGMESMTNAPQLLFKQRFGQKMGDSMLIDSMIYDGLWDVYNDMHMGNTGEVVSEEFEVAENKWMNLPQDQRLATEAESNGWFDWERFAMEIPQEEVH